MTLDAHAIEVMIGRGLDANDILAVARAVERPREEIPLIDMRDGVGPVARIQAEVARYYRISVSDILSDRRGAEVARPRQLAMLLCRQMTNKSLPAIGKMFGGRDHTTVMHACRAAESRIAEGDFEAADVAILRDRLGGETMRNSLKDNGEQSAKTQGKLAA